MRASKPPVHKAGICDVDMAETDQMRIAWHKKKFNAAECRKSWTIANERIVREMSSDLLRSYVSKPEKFTRVDHYLQEAEQKSKFESRNTLAAAEEEEEHEQEEKAAATQGEGELGKAAAATIGGGGRGGGAARSRARVDSVASEDANELTPILPFFRAKSNAAGTGRVSAMKKVNTFGPLCDADLITLRSELVASDPRAAHNPKDKALIARYAQLNPPITLSPATGERRTRRFNQRLTRRRKKTGKGALGRRRQQTDQHHARGKQEHRQDVGILPGLGRRSDHRDNDQEPSLWSKPSKLSLRLNLAQTQPHDSRPQSASQAAEPVQSSRPLRVSSAAPGRPIEGITPGRQRAVTARVRQQRTGVNHRRASTAHTHRKPRLHNKRRSRMAARLVAGRAVAMRWPVPPLPPLEFENEFVVAGLFRVASASHPRVGHRWIRVLSAIAPGLREVESAIVQTHFYFREIFEKVTAAPASRNALATTGDNHALSGNRLSANTLPSDEVHTAKNPSISVVDQLKLRLLEAVYNGNLFNVTNIIGSKILDINEPIQLCKSLQASASAMGQTCDARRAALGWPILLHACAAGRWAIVDCLLSEPGIDMVFRCPRTGCSALLLAAWCQSPTILSRLIQCLTEQGVNHSAVEIPPLAVAQRQASSGRVEVTPLCAAVIRGNVHAVALLMSAGFAPTQRPVQPSAATPVILATYLQNKALVHLLLQEQVPGRMHRELPVPDTSSQTPAADVNTPDRLGVSAVYYAVATQNSAVLSVLLRRGADPNHLLPITFDSLLASEQSQAQPNVAGTVDETDTQESCTVSLESPENGFHTQSTVPLEVAAMYGFLEGLSALRNHGAWTEHTDECGDTLAMHAVRNRDFDVLSVLLDGSGQHSRRNSQGDNIYMICSKNCNGLTVKSAVSRGLSERVHRKWVLRVRNLVRKKLLQSAIETESLPSMAVDEYADGSHTVNVDSDLASLQSVTPRTTLQSTPGALAARVLHRDVYAVLKTVAKAEVSDPNFVAFTMTLLLHLNSNNDIQSAQSLPHDQPVPDANAENLASESLSIQSTGSESMLDSDAIATSSRDGAAEVGVAKGCSGGSVSSSDACDTEPTQAASTQPEEPAMVAHVVAVVDFFLRTQAPYFDTDALLFHDIPSGEVRACYQRVCAAQVAAVRRHAQIEATDLEAEAKASREIATAAKAEFEAASQAHAVAKFGRARAVAKEVKVKADKTFRLADEEAHRVRDAAVRARLLASKLSDSECAPKLDTVLAMHGLFAETYPIEVPLMQMFHGGTESQQVLKSGRSLAQLFAHTSRRLLNANRILHLLKRSPLEVQLDLEEEALRKESAALRQRFADHIAVTTESLPAPQQTFSKAELEAADAPAIAVKKVLSTNTLSDLEKATRALSDALSGYEKRWSGRSVGPRSSPRKSASDAASRTSHRSQSSNGNTSLSVLPTSSYLSPLSEDGLGSHIIDEERERAQLRAERRNEKLLYAVQCGDVRSFLLLLHHDATLADQFRFAATHAASDQDGEIQGGSNSSCSTPHARDERHNDHHRRFRSAGDNLLTPKVGIRAPNEDDDEALANCRGQIGDDYQYNINAVSKAGFTALVTAIVNGSIQMVRECIRVGADIDMPVPSLQCTPLVAAILCQHEEIVAELLQCNPNPFRALPNGVAPIHAAVVAGNIKILSALVSSNNKLASVRVRAADATTPLHLAAYLGNLDVLRCLLDHIPPRDVRVHIETTDHLDRDALFIAVQNFHVEVAKELLSLKADPNRPCAHGHHFATTPLGVAVFHAQPQLVETLLAHGAEPDGTPSTRLGPLKHTPTMLAAFMGDFDVMRQLIRAGASIRSIRSTKLGSNGKPQSSEEQLAILETASQTVDRYRIVGFRSNEETDAARRIQKLSRRVLHSILLKKEKAARVLQVAANQRLLAKHKYRAEQATKIQTAIRKWQARQRKERRRELRKRLEKKQLTVMDCSQLLDLLTEWDKDKAQRAFLERQAKKIQSLHRSNLSRRVKRIDFAPKRKGKRLASAAKPPKPDAASGGNGELVVHDPDLLRDTEGACVEDLLARLWGLSLPQALHRAQVLDEARAKNSATELRDFHYEKMFRVWNLHQFGYITFHDVELVLRKNGLKAVFGRYYDMFCDFVFGRGSNQSGRPCFYETRRVQSEAADTDDSDARSANGDEVGQGGVERPFLRLAISREDFPICSDQLNRSIRRYELDISPRKRYILHAFSAQHREIATIVQRVLMK